MKKIILLIGLIVLKLTLNAQNTFPVPNGNVGIGTTSPTDILTISAGAARKGITITSDGDANVYSDIQFKITNPGSTPTGKATFWVASHRKDGFFSGSPTGESSLEFYTVKSGGGYWAPLCFSSNGDIILASSKNATSGNVGIGTVDTKGYKLAVNGSAIFTKAVVKSFGAWPDYVFEKNYQLMSLDSVENFIQTNKHLPNVPSAKEVTESGVDLGESQKILLQKTEELTLYLIEQNKKIQSQSEVISNQSKQINNLELIVKQLQQDMLQSKNSTSVKIN